MKDKIDDMKRIKTGMMISELMKYLRRMIAEVDCRITKADICDHALMITMWQSEGPQTIEV